MTNKNTHTHTNRQIDNATDQPASRISTSNNETDRCAGGIWYDLSHGKKTLRYKSHPWWCFGTMVAYCSRSMYMYVALRQTRLVLGWVTVRGFKFCCTYPGQISLESLHSRQKEYWLIFYRAFWEFCTKAYLTLAISI